MHLRGLLIVATLLAITLSGCSKSGVPECLDTKTSGLEKHEADAVAVAEKTPAEQWTTYRWVLHVKDACADDPVSALVIFTVEDKVAQASCNPAVVMDVHASVDPVGQDSKKVALTKVQDQGRTGWTGNLNGFLSETSIEEDQADYDVIFSADFASNEGRSTDDACAVQAFVGITLSTTYTPK